MAIIVQGAVLAEDLGWESVVGGTKKPSNKGLYPEALVCNHKADKEEAGEKRNFKNEIEQEKEDEKEDEKKMKFLSCVKYFYKDLCLKSIN